jgi:hypothetical protein
MFVTAFSLQQKRLNLDKFNSLPIFFILIADDESCVGISSRLWAAAWKHKEEEK